MWTIEFKIIYLLQYHSFFRGIRIYMDFIICWKPKCNLLFRKLKETKNKRTRHKKKK